MSHAGKIMSPFNVPQTSAEILETRAASLRRLQTLFRIAEGAWALALFESVDVRALVQEELRQALAPLPLCPQPLLGEPRDLLTLLEALETDHPAPVVAFTLPKGQDDLLRICRNLDLQRESLARTPQRLLLWVDDAQWRFVAEHAPNFYSRISGLFRFPGSARGQRVASPPAATAAAEMSAAPNAPTRDLPEYTPAERAQQIAYWQRRIDDLNSLARRDPASVGEAWHELGEIHARADFHGVDDPQHWLHAEAAYAEAARAYAEAQQPLAEAASRERAGYAALRHYAADAALDHLQHAFDQLGTIGLDNREAAQIAANVLKAQGDVLHFLKQTEEALASYEQALGLFRAVGDRLGEANVLQAQGDVLHFLKQTEEALASYEQALGLFRAVGDRLGEANVLQAQGDVLHFLDQREEALASYEQALGLFRAVGDRLGEANVLQAQGDVLHFLKQTEEALASYEQALGLFRAVGDRLGEANVLKAQGDVLHFLKQTEEALASYEQALGLFRAVGDRLGEANVLQAQGDVLHFLKQTEEALASYEQALGLFRAVGARLGEANVLKAQGDVLHFLKQTEEALASYEQALGLFRAVGDRLGEANVLQAQGDVLHFLKQTEEALASYEQALGLFRAVGARLGEANVLQAQGQLFLQNDKIDEGMTLLLGARELYVAVGARAGQANVSIVLARHAARQHDIAAATTLMQAAVDFCREIGHPLADSLQAEIDGWRTQLAEALPVAHG